MRGPSLMLGDNPLGIAAVVALVHFALMMVAMHVQARRNADRAHGQSPLWGVAIFCLPVVGPVLYLVLGRR